ncbi:hypothetical protein [Salinicoccus halodurans]|uniref:Uncharacterized protein n=1 Tax=Salinicoccus halodurans TaxID=407035 RepID=A0A0F7HLA0_9STAP|nr:hypothetical protein [Salinicoccus halodurans]AKG74353.1 hypothetical protein AAT16_08975 [Salinicoccus halodurans]SFK94901.1 hypothetical protein SAMN05216235_2692 [Salinicoccus halodurans]
MEQDFGRKMAFVNGEWSQALSRSYDKIAGLIMELEAKDTEIGKLHEENKNLQSEVNRLKDSSQ